MGGDRGVRALRRASRTIGAGTTGAGTTGTVVAGAPVTVPGGGGR